MSSHQMSQLRALSTVRKARLARKTGVSRIVRKSQGRDLRDMLAGLVEKEVTTGLSRIFESHQQSSSGGGVKQMGVSSSGPTAKGGVLDQRHMEATIDQMVAASLVGGRQTSGVLRALFGLVPSLIGR